MGTTISLSYEKDEIINRISTICVLYNKDFLKLCHRILENELHDLAIDIDILLESNLNA